ncbi:MAG: glycosyltransferase family 2 protein [Candidatus Nitrohelix vancouverensis]|uniref:Glycosyltransferase family 2 protein n=1 Tax=Candidatus Nitrohelix vancouverensis TaxID=2705534 RepID=A0A7T0G3R9_9BACT|nr:MAG: glycosyltransferase family 2 protein [Candidatus Nitrohelix vancouverensis]
MNQLSVVIISFNEEKNIERCLKSVQWADEIVVLDSFSTDRTLEICKRYTNCVFQGEWRGYGAQKNLCADKASHSWVLNLDADEAVTPEGAEEIQRMLSQQLEFPAYDFPRKNFIGERWIRFCGWYPDRIIRLYDKRVVRFTEGKVHERLQPDDRVGAMREALLHYSFHDMADYVQRQNRYSSLAASERAGSGKKSGWANLILNPLWVFLKCFFLRQGFREGRLGFFISASMAYYTFLKYAKVGEELEKLERRPDDEG